jgi:uncharacterized protein YwgA
MTVDGWKMKRRDILLTIIALCSTRPEFGRTALQKVAYFVGFLREAGFRHQAHYYGPFSDVVEADVEALALSGLIEERVQSLAFVGSSGHQARRYEYRLTEAGRRRVEGLRSAHPSEFTTIDDFVQQLVEAAGGLDQNVLSAAAKTFFIANREKRDLSTTEVRALARELGWSLGPKQIKRVAGVLHRLNLVEVASGSDREHR